MIAAFGHLEVGGRRRRGDQTREKIMLGFRVEVQTNRTAPGARIFEKFNNTGVCAGADDAVDLGDERLQLFAETLRETTRDDELLIRPLARRMLKNHVG